MNDFLAYCPFHGNTNTPSFSVSRDTGKFICFNASCSETGSLLELVMRTTKRNMFEAARLILKRGSETQESFAAQLAKALNPEPEFPEFSQDKLDQMYEAFWSFQEPVDYMMEERGFTEETLRKFRIGYSLSKNLITVPMHDPKGNPVGVIGRSPDRDNKVFKNSKKLPSSRTLWNLHRAKRHGGTAIVVEASFDGMRVDQAGYSNVVALLSGHASPYHFDLLNKYFDTIVIMTDFDKKEKYFYDNCKKCLKRGLKMCVGHNPGRDLGHALAAGLQNKNILWASYEDGMVYPNGAKDAGDMTDDEIRQCLQNAVPDFIYNQWGLY